MISLITPAEAQQTLLGYVKQRRLSRNMKQTTLSLKSGVPLASVRQFERTGKISLTSFIKLAFVLDLLPSLLAALHDEPTIRSIDDLLKEKIKPPKKRARE